jgi:hypothetical protein
MAGIEAHLITVILCRAALRQPVSCAEELALANSLIQGMVEQVELMEWNKMHLKNGTHYDSCATLGPRYWQNFYRRNKYVISSKKAARFDSMETIGIIWKFSRTCMIVYMENLLRQAFKRS